MKARIEQRDLTPGGLRAMLGLKRYLATCGLEKKLLDLIYLRVSQMNGCAYCLDMHWKDLLAEGETEQRMYSLDGWRETPYYSDRERAALAWAEAVTRVTDTLAPDDVYELARRHFDAQRARRSDPRDGRHQRLEPAEHRVSDHPRDLSSHEVSRRCGGLMRG